MFNSKRRFNDTSGDGFFNIVFVAWLAIAAINLALIGFGVWVVIKLLTHFGVI